MRPYFWKLHTKETYGEYVTIVQDTPAAVFQPIHRTWLTCQTFSVISSILICLPLEGKSCRQTINMQARMMILVLLQPQVYTPALIMCCPLYRVNPLKGGQAPSYFHFSSNTMRSSGSCRQLLTPTFLSSGHYW